MAGMHKHKWSYTVKYAPDHFGHDQFRPPKQTLTKRWLNLDDLPLVARNSTSVGSLDLGAMGFDKLLGQGKVSQSFSIKVPRASSKAIEKVKAAGGSVEVEQPEARTVTEKEGKGSKPKENKQMPAASIKS
jgi:large subunit ribosomal protein L15